MNGASVGANAGATVGFGSVMVRKSGKRKECERQDNKRIGGDIVLSTDSVANKSNLEARKAILTRDGRLLAHVDETTGWELDSLEGLPEQVGGTQVI